MDSTFLKTHQSLSKLPALSTNSSKLFRTKDQLLKTKTILLQRLDDKEANQDYEAEANEKGLKNMRRSFIQFPKSNSNQMFTSFKNINKFESKQIMSEFPKLRSQSTHLRAFVKAEIVYNKNQLELIKKMADQKIRIQRQIIAKKIKQLTPNKMKKQVTIKQKYKAKASRVIGIRLTMNFDVYEHNLQAWKPFVDYDSIPMAIQNSYFFIGGRKNCPIVQYNLLSNKWGQLPQIKGLKPFGDCPLTLIGQKIYSFGGYNYYQQGFSMISNSMKTLDIMSRSYKVEQFDQKKVNPRAFHDQCIYGKYMVISGGLDKDSHFIKGFTTYQIENGFWNQLTINKYPDQLSAGFAKHKTISLFHKRKIYSIYNEQEIVQMDSDISEQGIYLYGGETGNGSLNSKMYIVKVGYPSVNIIQAKIDGKYPLARRNMAMIRHKQFIIIHGGRNDQMRPFALQSMHFLNIKTMNWIEVVGERPPYRYSQGVSVRNGQIIIMGGKTHEGLSKEVYIMPYEEMIQQI